MRSPVFTAAVLLLSSTVSAAPASRAPLTWRDVSGRYAAVHDFTCLYEKEEQAISNGERQRIKLSFRKPLDVRLEWLDDHDNVDQIAVYRDGYNDGKLIVRRRGLLGSVLGTMRLDPRDKRALEDSRHPITEVGIGAIIERGMRALASGHMTVEPSIDDTLDGRPASRFTFQAPSGQALFDVPRARRALVWIDGALGLPLQVEIFDEPGRVLERHRFRNLRVNPGLGDEVFTL